MRTEEFDAEWDPRIGPEAARARQSAYQYVRYFFASGAATIAVAFTAGVSRTMPLWLSILISVVIVTWLFFVVLTWSTFSIRMKRAGRLTYEYLANRLSSTRGSSRRSCWSTQGGSTATWL
ncbi:hypothetical protein AHiyo6_03570 [Arthrobacter sp. Hiyo6]|nr:hypothetical protein AHiyo6_03570 [Arthrobacter sp. Hiyo6]